jgi:hypothetical protein
MISSIEGIEAKVRDSYLEPGAFVIVPESGLGSCIVWRVLSRPLELVEDAKAD